MNSVRFVLSFLLIIFLLFSCSSSKKVQKKPPLKYYGLTMSKSVEKQNTEAIPKEPTNKFTNQDEEIVAHLKFENLSGTHNLRWEWYDPQGNLYHTTADFPLKASKGKYMKQATAWHSLVVKGDNAADLPGQWNVKVYINDEFVDSETFMLASLTKSVELKSIVAAKPLLKDWGFIIGVQDYAHLPSVDYARKDALIIREYFIKVLGVPEENIITLIDSDATKGQIEGYLENYIPANVDKATTLYVYFAGHGAPGMDKGDPYIVPYDGDIRFIEQTGYKLQKLYQDLEKMDVRQTYVFLDSCFSGVASRAAEMLAKGVRPTLMHTKEIELKNDKVISLSATSQGQTSNPYPDAEHGLFTYYLLKAMRGDADTDEDQWVSVKEMYDYVAMHVPKVARRLGSDQTPSINPPVDSLRDIAVGRVAYTE